MKGVIIVFRKKRVLGPEISSESLLQSKSRVITKAADVNDYTATIRNDIFRDTILEAGRNLRSKLIALPLSILFHLLFVALLVGLPLMNAGSLPPVQVYSAFLAPIPSPTPPPAPPKGDGKAGSGKIQAIKKVPVETGKLIVPIEIPENIPEDELTGQGHGFGVPWGVKYPEGKNIWNETLENLIGVPAGKEEESVRAMGEIKPPRLLHRVEPEYPDAAIKARVEGIVILEATTDVYGRVQNVRVLRSVPLLERAAIEAVKEWIYEPMVINGRPRPVTFTVTIIFQQKK